MSKYQGATCRGSYLFGSACGHCERCKDEMESLRQAGKLSEIRPQNLPKYEILIIDPPWQKRKGGLRKARPNQGRKLDYETMTTEDIFLLLDEEVFSLAEEQHVVFMWTIEQFLIDCDAEMLKRGYKRHVRMIWNKTNGVAPAFTIRYAHEYLVWYYKPKLLKIAENQRGKYLSVITEKARQHSRKPDEAYNMINNLYPNSKKIDVFSREKRDGFSQWGNEVDFFNCG